MSFAILLFFAATGLTLNHAEWFEGRVNTARYQGTLDASWTRTPDPKAVDQEKIVEFLRRTNGVKGDVSDFQNFMGAVIDRFPDGRRLSLSRVDTATVTSLVSDYVRDRPE